MRFDVPKGANAYYEPNSFGGPAHNAHFAELPLKVSGDADNGAGLTPIMFAAMFGRTRVVEQLQAHGASLRRRNRLGISARRMVRISHWVGRLLRRPGLRPGVA